MKKINVVLSLVVLSFAVACVGFSAGEKPSSGKEVLTIEIHHCTKCGYLARATSLADELFNEFGVKANLIVGEVGTFDVFVNGDLIFSKKETKRFPTPGEVTGIISEYLKK